MMNPHHTGDSKPAPNPILLSMYLFIFAKLRSFDLIAGKTWPTGGKFLGMGTGSIFELAPARMQAQPQHFNSPIYWVYTFVLWYCLERDRHVHHSHCITSRGVLIYFLIRQSKSIQKMSPRFSLKTHLNWLSKDQSHTSCLIINFLSDLLWFHYFSHNPVMYSGWGK